MNVVKCESGHFYDADLYLECPHCMGREKTGPKTKKKTGLFARHAKPQDGVKLPAAEAKQKAEGSLCGPTELLQSIAECPECGKPPRRDAAAEEKRQEHIPQAGKAAEQPGTEGECREEPGASASPSLPVYVHGADTLSEKTVGFFCDSPESDPPCVGWLVGLTGVYRGVSLELKPGGNTIGRGADNRIVLSKDNRVSRDTQAYIAYEPRERKYYMEAGKSTALSYVNGKVILHRSVLSGGDMIEMGGGKYLFVPLCGDTFSWENYPEFRPICREGIC